MKTRDMQDIKLLEADVPATMQRIKERFGSLQTYVVSHWKCEIPPTSVRAYMNTGRFNTVQAQNVLRRMKRDGVLVEKDQEALDRAA